MPVYILHGFRWPRVGGTGIRTHTICHDLEECSADYIQNSNSTSEILRSFWETWPMIMEAIVSQSSSAGSAGLQFIEQYDPEDDTSENAFCQPFAFVADKVVTLAGGSSTNPVAPPSRSEMTASSDATKQPTAESRKKTGSVKAGMAAAAAQKSQALSLNLEEVFVEGRGLSVAAWDAMADLRDQIAEGEEIGWYVVYNGDPERAYYHSTTDEEDEAEDGYEHKKEGESETEADEKQKPAAFEQKSESDDTVVNQSVGTTGIPSTVTNSARNLSTPSQSSRRQPPKSSLSSRMGLATSISKTPTFRTTPNPSTTPAPGPSTAKSRHAASATSSSSYASPQSLALLPSPSTSNQQSLTSPPPPPPPPEGAASPSKSSGKRLPGMKATPPSAGGHQPQRQKEETELERDQRQSTVEPPQSPPSGLPRQQYHMPAHHQSTTESSSSRSASQDTEDERSSKVSLKSDSLKRKLFGKRG